MEKSLLLLQFPEKINKTITKQKKGKRTKKQNNVCLRQSVYRRTSGVYEQCVSALIHQCNVVLLRYRVRSCESERGESDAGSEEAPCGSDDSRPL